MQDLPSNIALLMRRSSDGGRTWSEPQVIRSESAPHGFGDPSVLVDCVTGKVFVFHAASIEAGVASSTTGSGDTSRARLTWTSHEPMDTGSPAEPMFRRDVGFGRAEARRRVARQHPSTSKGTVFLLLEDEFGFVNIIVPAKLYRKNREVVRHAPFILIEGRFEGEGEVKNVVGLRFRQLRSPSLSHRSRDFH